MKYLNQSGGDDVDFDKIVLETAILTRVNDLRTFLNHNLFTGGHITPLVITLVGEVKNSLLWNNILKDTKTLQLYRKYMDNTITDQSFRKSLELYQQKMDNLLTGFYTDEAIIYNILRELNKCVLRNPKCFEEHIIQIREFCRNALLPFLNFQQYMNTFILTNAPEQLRDAMLEYINPIIIPVADSIQQIEQDINDRINSLESIVRIYIKRGYPERYPENNRTIIGGHSKTRKHRKLHR